MRENQREKLDDTLTEKSLTIALVVDTLGNSGNGTSNSALQFAHELEKRGVEVRLVGVGSPDERYRAKELYIPVVTEYARPHQVGFARPDDEFFARAFDGVDIIHIYMPFTFGRRAALYARKHGIPVTAGFHVQPENVLYSAPFLRIIPRPSGAIYRWLYRYFYRFVDHLHVPTAAEAQRLKVNGYDQNLHVFSNGYDDTLFVHTPTLHRLDCDSERIHIVAAGRLSAEKNHRTLIEALALSRYASRIDLTIAGTGALKDRLIELANQLPQGCTARIGFVPHEKIGELYAQADLCVHPSYADIEGISVLEAMAMGAVPIISDDPRNAARLFALTEESLFHVTNPCDLAERIDWWIEHPDERARYSELYASHTRQTYSVSSSVDAFIEMIEQARVGINSR